MSAYHVTVSLDGDGLESDSFRMRVDDERPKRIEWYCREAEMWLESTVLSHVAWADPRDAALQVALDIYSYVDDCKVAVIDVEEDR